MPGQKPQKSKPRAAIRLASGGSLRYSTQGGGTLVRITLGNQLGKAEIMLARDETIAPESPVLQFTVLGEQRGVYVVTDSYPSWPGPMSYCGTGLEQFVRVLARSADFRETFCMKVQSCRWNLELGPAGLVWDSVSSTLMIDALGRDLPRRYKVDAEGLVEEARY
jgi:hypothetical protein